MKELNRLAKWRKLLTGWQLGTRTEDDPEAQAVRDHREATLLLRAEVTALAVLMIEKGVFTETEFNVQIEREAAHYQRLLEAKFPGFIATDIGMQVDVAKAAETMKGWKP